MKYRECLDAIDSFMEKGKAAMMERIREMPSEREDDDEFLVVELKEGLEWLEDFDRAKDMLIWFYNEGAERLSELDVTGGILPSEKGKKGRILNVEVTQGMLNQSLLTLTEPRKRGLIELGETMRIELPDGTRFTTKFTSPGNRLKERSQIRYFYQKWKIQPDDKLTLKEVSKGEWELGKFDLRKVAMEYLK